MQTNIHPALIGHPQIDDADSILRSCVHCGFCTATCPTYQVLGDELDGPRGRIYLIKNLLEDNAITERAATHLDRCLSCRACETTCPSGVEYGRLLDIGRELASTRREASVLRRTGARLLSALVQMPSLFRPLFLLGQGLRPLLPAFLKQKVLPAGRRVATAPVLANPLREVVVLQGCAQRAVTPAVNRALANLLAEHQVQVRFLAEEGCCGALDYHATDQARGLDRMRRMVDRLSAESLTDAPIVSTASGCGVTVKDYDQHLAHDPVYAGRAQAVASRVLDAIELVSGYEFHCQPLRVAVHDPCTLQHGQRLGGRVAALLDRAGARIVPVPDAHLCCGSAGTYSIMQPAIAGELRTRKLAALTQEQPDVIVTANVGCQLHLGAAAEVPVMHWVEFLYHHALK